MSAYLDHFPEDWRTSFLDMGEHDACLDWVRAVAEALDLVGPGDLDGQTLALPPVYELANAEFHARSVKDDSVELRRRPAWCEECKQWEWPFSCEECSLHPSMACPACRDSTFNHKPAGSPESRYDT